MFLVLVITVLVITVLVLAVTVLVTVIILRPPTTTTAPPPPQTTGRPAEATTPPPTSTATSTTNVPPPVAPAEQTWTQAWPQLKQITMPGGIGDVYGATFDTPRVVLKMYISDLSYQSGSLAFSSNLVSTGPATLPAPEACAYAARNQAIGEVKLVPGITSWCIVTGRGSLVWLHLLSREDSAFPTLTFELMRWEETS